MPRKRNRHRARASKVPPLPDDAAQRFQMGATAAEINLASTSATGAWTAATLALWGVAWPPKAGWRTQLVENAKRNRT